MKKDNFWHYSFDIPNELKNKERNISVNVEIPNNIPEGSVLQYRDSIWSPILISSGSTFGFSGTSGNSGLSGNAGTSGNSGFIPASDLTNMINILNQNFNMLLNE